MYIVKNDSGFELSQNESNAVVKINNPKYIIDNKEYEITDHADGLFYVTYDFLKESDCLFKVKRRWKNISDKVLKFQTVFETEELFAAERYLIPCVSFDGNKFGNGGEPKGLECEGKPWIFAYDRMSIPSCSMVENERFATALFASMNDFKSMRSACSVLRSESGFKQRIIHPEKEAPKTYSSRDMYEDEYNRYAELEPNGELETEMYIYIAKPMWKNFGMAGLLDVVIDMTAEPHKNNDINELWDRSIAYAKSLITNCYEKKGFIIGYTTDDNNGFKKADGGCFELAWCGQNILFCRMLILDYIKNKNKESLDAALEIMDNWIDNCRVDNGLMATRLEHYPNLLENEADTCNLGYGAYEIYRVYELLKSVGIEKESYFDAAKGLCDFFVKNYSGEVGFGKTWSLKGEIIENEGTIGAFVILPMCKLYNATGDEAYLKTAEKAMDYYCRRDLDNFACAAGALDSCCVDKETSAPLIFAGIMLYEITKDTKYLEYAQKAAYYFASWMYHYHPYYDENCDISRLGIDVTGFTAVSTQHHHLDCYAGIVVPYLYRLAEYTKDERWRKRADLMFNAAVQVISDGTDEVHGRIRPRGAQNEAYFQCRWWHGPAMTADTARGNANDWLVAWMCAFRLSAIAEL